jgi:hypothetical protein
MSGCKSSKNKFTPLHYMLFYLHLEAKYNIYHATIKFHDFSAPDIENI